MSFFFALFILKVRYGNIVGGGDGDLISLNCDCLVKERIGNLWIWLTSFSSGERLIH